MTSQIIRRNVPEDCPAFPDVPTVLSRVYQARGVREASELELRLQSILNHQKMKGLSRAANLLAEAITCGKRIMIVGDFDADGATSTALCMLTLKNFGARDVEYLVPNRFEFGYGLSPEIVELAAEKKPDLIVTVDNGISSIEGVKLAHEKGIKVLITDHHLPGKELPDAEAIVNPNQVGCEFESKNAAGVGVIFYVLSKVRSVLRERGWFEGQALPEPSMAGYLDLVALGTVADLVPLDRNNRILVEQGIRRIRSGQCRPAIQALLKIAGREGHSLVASDLGFIIGPRLNAAGRLDDMSLGIECLLAEDEAAAFALAQELDAMNSQRKTIEESMKKDAESKMQALAHLEKSSVYGLSLYDSSWHQGVIGILASRIKEKLHRPVVVFAPAIEGAEHDEAELKGSARSIPGFHMRDALDLLAKRHPHILKKFGGHAMAAGMTITFRDYHAFSEAFAEISEELLSDEDLEAKWLSDGELSEQDLDLKTVEILQKAGPWGQQFPEPRFDGVFSVIQRKVLKEKHLKLVLRFQDSHTLFDAIQFNSDWVRQDLPETIRVLYRPAINHFRGRRTVQFMLDYIEAP